MKLFRKYKILPRQSLFNNVLLMLSRYNQEDAKTKVNKVIW